MFARSLNLCRAIQREHKRRIYKEIVRHGSAYVYRSGPKPMHKYIYLTSEVAAATMWWWVLWHLISEPDHITGEFPWPDASSWTNAELGIPDALEE